MTECFDKARELGNLILLSDKAKLLADANNEFMLDFDAKEKMDEYKKYQENVKESMQNKDTSKEEITIMTRRLTEMATELKEIPTVAALVFAENEYNAFVNNVMGIVKATIMGQNTECDSGSCSSCSGCGQ